MLMKQLLFLALAVLSVPVSCEHVDHTGEINDPEARIIPLEDVAKLLSALPIETDQMTEVHDAVSSSDGNGYDEEYMMRDLLSVPGTGVGDEAMGKSMSTRSYSRPLKELIAEQLSTRTKSSDGSVLSPEEYLDALEKSNMQIYWPYYRNWDGKEWPIVTFDPGNGLRPTSDIVFLLIRRETVRWKQSSWMRRWLLHILSGWSTVIVTVDLRPWKCIEEKIRSGGLEAAPSRCVRLLDWSALRHRLLRLSRKVHSGHLSSMISR